jgi:hypothetical protein
MNFPLFGKMLDERFFTHRMKSTSTAGIATALLAIALFAWRFYVDRIWSWDLFAVAVTFVAIKMSLMTWYYLTD